VRGADLLVGETVSLKRVIADCDEDANRISAALHDQGTIPVVAGCRNCTGPIQYDERCHKDRWQVEAMLASLQGRSPHRYPL
jgi:hypothetical protein